MLDIEDKMLTNLNTGDYEGFIKIGMEYADAVIRTESDYTDSISKLFAETGKNKKVELLAATDETLDEEKYYNFYNELVG